MRYILLLVIALFVISCGQKKKDAKEYKASLEITNNPIESEQILSDFTTNQKTLNDIRFGDWTDEDWYDNDYFHFLRQTFNDFLAGKIEREDFIPYKSILNSKFAILEANEFIYGGLSISIIFLDAPDKVFSVNIYSEVDKVSETVTSYKLLGFKLNDGYSGLTKENILQLVKEHPENQLW